jgi:hypothetical protein
VFVSRASVAKDTTFFLEVSDLLFLRVAYTSIMMIKYEDILKQLYSYQTSRRCLSEFCRFMKLFITEFYPLCVFSV